MTADEYVKSILAKYAINVASSKAAAETIALALPRWANNQIDSLDYSGSFAKGTATSLSTDVDIFISLKSNTTNTLREIYDSLYNFAQKNGWNPRKQNVSIRIRIGGRNIDLVPGNNSAGIPKLSQPI